MNPPEIIRFPTPDLLAEAAGRLWLQQIQATRADRPSSVALSGGRIAGRFFSAVADQAKAHRHLFDRVQFFWADERCVPPEDPESNFALAQEHLLGPLEIRVAQVHRIRGELDRHAAAREAEREIRQIVPLTGSGEPLLDLVFLGMGEDGHVASLFPNEPEEAASSPAVYRGVIGPKPPPERVTISYATLGAAREVWVLASGGGKEDALRHSLQPGAQTPLGRLLRMRQRTRILTDIPV